MDILGDEETESVDGPSRTFADRTVQNRTLEVPADCYVRLESMGDAPTNEQSGQAGKTKAKGASAKKRSASKTQAKASTPGKYTGVYRMREHSRQKNAVIRQIEWEKLESEARRDYALMNKS